MGKYLITTVLLLLLNLSFPVSAMADTLLSFFPGGKPNGFLFSALLLLGLFGSLAVHELGHLLTGMAFGFRFELFVVFILGIRRKGKGIELFFNKNLGYMGGVAATIPMVKKPENKTHFAYMILAGPIASLVFSALSFYMIFNTKSVFWSFWLISAATSIGVFLATTLPNRSGIFFTDRARFQRLMSKGKDAESEEALLSIIAQSTADQSCKNIELNDARTLQADRDVFMRFWGYYYEYGFHKDNDHTDLTLKSQSELLKMKPEMPKAIWNALKIDE